MSPSNVRSRLLAAGLIVLLSAPDLGAQAGSLILEPRTPTAGEIVEFRYASDPQYESATDLVLRARLYSTTSRGPALVQLAALTRARDGFHRAAFQLSGTEVYAVLAVEDPAGERIDTGAEEWELIVHGADGSPLREALQARVADLGTRNSLQAVETARRLAELYPEHLDSWLRLFNADREITSPELYSSLIGEHQRYLSAWLEEGHFRTSLPVDEIVAVISYADALGDSVLVRVWSDRLVLEHPHHPASIRLRLTAAAADLRDGPEALLAAYDEAWEDLQGDGMSLALSGFRLAQQIRNPIAVAGWAERLEAHDTFALAMIARTTLQIPELRTFGMQQTRRWLPFLEQPRDAHRPIDQTRTEQRLLFRRATGIFLGEIGAAILAEGRPAAALDTLDLAVRAAWNPQVFRLAAELRLSRGDTATARSLLARVAADPETSPTFSDSVAFRLGSHLSVGAWEEEINAARAEMAREVWAFAIERTPSGVWSGLVDGTGARVDLVTSGNTPMLVAFWSPYCPSSRAQLRELEQLARKLSSSGFRIATITAGAPTQGLQGFITEHGHTFPVLFDTEGEAARGLGARTTPNYLVLDSHGRIRFQRNVLDDVTRQLHVLRAGDVVVDGTF